MKQLTALCLLVCLTAAALAVEPDADRARALVKQLGADTFKQREAAQKELSAMPRSVLPVLREFENTKDPEIKDRLAAAIHAILTDTSRIPQKFHTYRDATYGSTMAARKVWAEALAKWQAESTVSLCNTNGRSSSSSGFVQRFIPRARQLRAIAVQAYPISSTGGWLSLDIRTDKDERPDTGVLARSWLRMEKRCAPHGSFAVFTLPDIKLDSDKPHWMVLTSHPDDNNPGRTVINYRLDLKLDNPELRMLPMNGRPTGSANFLLLTECPLPSWLREATDDERKTVPALPVTAFEWWNHTEPNAATDVDH